MWFWNATKKERRAGACCLNRSLLMQSLKILFAFLLVSAAACSQTVKPIGLQELVVPLDARRFVADAQDGVSIAKSHVDDAEMHLEKMEHWHATVKDSGWPSNANARASLTKLSEARLKIVKMELELANAEFELAEAKYELVTARTAIRHDLATYELKPLRERQEAALDRVGRLVKDIEAEQRTLEQLTGDWWTQYAGYSQGGGSTQEFFTTVGTSD